GYHAMMNADTLVLLGTQFPYRAFYPTNATSFKVNSGQIYLQRIISCLYSSEQSFPTLPW
ncbi:hypothetical protein, partial [Serratia sp. CY43514]|uniref:hypothetical protein n=1 Tax=Serratia sp. CY43514 TaxID=3383620 RepID=UPI004025EB3F